MGRIVETKITRFDGGHSEDKRVKDLSKFSLTKHFDVFTYPHKLVPYSKTEVDEDKTFVITRFLYAPYYTGGAWTYRLYGMGIKVGFTTARIYVYDIDVGTFAGWAGAANAAISESTLIPDANVFFYYKEYIYMWAGVAAGKLIRYDTENSDNFNNAYQSIAYTTVAPPVHHPADDIAYFFTDNIVHKLDDTTFSPAVLTLPSQFKIVSACAYGNYLAIGCVTKGVFNRQSIVFLWDRDSSLTTLTDRIDFGEGELKYLANLNNKLIGVMDFYIGSLFGMNKGKVIIKQASGNFAVPLNELTTDSYSGANQMPTNCIVKNNKLYFVLGLALNNDARGGIWAVDENGRVALDFIEEEATTSFYNGIYVAGNMWWIAHSSDGSVNRSDNAVGYSATMPSIYESLIFNTGDSDLTKKLIGATVMTEKLPSGSRVILKYRKDGATAWKPIFVNVLNNSISHGAINFESLTATMTIDTPAVVILGDGDGNLLTHGLVAGDKFYFTTTGALPTGVSADKVYYVISAGLTSTAFEFSATLGGSAINTSGSESGVHTLNFIDGLGEHKEIEFRIESYGGAVITGLKFKEEIISKELY